MNKHNAKRAYLSKEIAKKYEKERFSHFIGKIIDRMERSSVIAALKLCGANKGDIICDIACGTGRISETLIESGFNVIGIDYSFQMLSEAKRKKLILENVKGLVAMDASEMALKNKSFDFTVSMRFFGHIPKEHRLRILKEILRISKRNMIIAYYSFFSLHTLYRFIRFITTGKFYGYTVTKRSLEKEVGLAGSKIKKIIPMMRFIHQGWIVILEHV